MSFKTSVFEYLMGGHKGDRLIGVHSERTRGQGQKLKQGKIITRYQSKILHRKYLSTGTGYSESQLNKTLNSGS